MRTWLSRFVLLLWGVPASANAQARIDTILPGHAVIEVQRLGSDRSLLATPGMELTPGDLLSTSVDGVAVKLSCGTQERTNTYDLVSPFRVLIDVPSEAPCHVNLLSGLTEVIAEAPSETSAGGVTLGSSGTQYTVEVRRAEGSLAFRCIVYDDSVTVRARTLYTAKAGWTLVWQPDGTYLPENNTAEDIDRSANVRTIFDIAAARGRGTLSGDSAAYYVQLHDLHSAVLANPTDTARSVNLAKAQLNLQLTEQARFNLERVDVNTETKMREYGIDPAYVRRDLQVSTLSPSRVRLQPGIVLAPTTDTDLRLIETGQVDAAISNIQGRIESGSATSRDYYALAKAYAQRGDATLVRSSAGRALVLCARDNLLASAELRELGELIARLG